MRVISTIILLLMVSLVCKSQQYNCPDSVGPISSTFSSYSVDSFRTKTPVQININRIFVNGKAITVNFKYSDNIEFETPLLPVTDSAAVKLVLCKTQVYGKKRYMYALILYHRDGSCWIENKTADFMTIVPTQECKLMDGAGSPNSSSYIQIVDGYLRLN